MEDSGGYCRNDFQDTAGGGHCAPVSTPAAIATLLEHPPIIPAANGASLAETFIHTAAAKKLDELTDEELDASIEEDVRLKQEIENRELLRRGEKIRRKLAVFDGMLETLDDEEAPEFGARFVKRVNSANMGFEVTYNGLLSPAVYTAYSLAEANRGFVNKMRFHPDALKNLFDMFLYSTHERGHGIENHDVDALRCSPFNPASLAVVHPLHWAALELHCERDTIAQTAFIASKMEELMPGLRQHTINEKSILTVEEFEDIRKKAPSLMDAMVTASLRSLTKLKTDTLTYEDTYCGSALDHMSAGLYWRQQFELGDVTFVRLTESDFHAVGRHGIIPNTMGERFMEPLLLREPRMNDANRAKYDKICKDYNIPNLYDCQTLGEYRAQEAGLAISFEPSTIQMAAGRQETRSFQMA